MNKRRIFASIVAGLMLAGCGTQPAGAPTTANAGSNIVSSTGAANHTGGGVNTTGVTSNTSSGNGNSTAASTHTGDGSPPPVPAHPAPSGPGKVDKIHFYSKALKKQMALEVYTPPGYKSTERYPVLYMIHGLTGGADSWFGGLNLNRKADMLIDRGEVEPMIIVTPDMENSFGLDSSPKTITELDTSDSSLTWNEGMYETYLVKDVLQYVEAHYRTMPDAQHRYIGGFSMGGFIALHTAFKYPNLFSKVSGDSPAISVQGGTAHFPFADYSTQDKWDPASLAQTKDLSSVKVYLDCGKDDEYAFYIPVQALADTLKSRGVSVETHINEGTHSVEYWMNHEDDYLKFFGGIK